MTNEELCNEVLQHVGGRDNVVSATNCMTRLRIHVKDDAGIDDAGLESLEGVICVIHDQQRYTEVVVGPGKSKKCSDILRDWGIPSSADTGVSDDWQSNKAAIKEGQREGRVKRMLRSFGEIFAPLIPGVIVAGLCAGFGGAFVMLMQVASTTWGPSGLLGMFVMTAGPAGAMMSVVYYLIGSVISAVMGFVITWFGIKGDFVAEA